MLVLTRKQYERVRLRIPDGKGGWIDVWVGIAMIASGRVRLGIEAPDEVQVAREELVLRNDHGPTT